MIIHPSHRIGKVETYYFARKLRQIAEMERAGANVINLGIGSPDLLPPPEVIQKLKDRSDKSPANKYQSYKGIPELRQAFSDWYERYFSVQLDPESEVLPLIGSKEGIMHIAMTYLHEGDQALVPNPGYPAYAMTTKLAGAEPLFYNLEEGLNWKPDLKKLAKTDLSRIKIMWLNYPNMPTGVPADETFFKELVEFAHEHKILLCHDNPYAFILNEKPLSLLSIEGAKEVCIELNSLSKCFNMAGWRVGAMVGKAGYIDAVMKFKSNMDSGMYRPVQEAAVVALSLGDDWFSELNAIYAKRREEVWKTLDLLGCSYDPQSVGLFVWGKIPDHIADAENWSEQILQESHVFLTPGFIFGDCGERYLRISLCSDEAVFKKAQSRLASFLMKKKRAIA